MNISDNKKAVLTTYLITAIETLREFLANKEGQKYLQLKTHMDTPFFCFTDSKKSVNQREYRLIRFEGAVVALLSFADANEMLAYTQKIGNILFAMKGDKDALQVFKAQLPPILARTF